MSDSTAFLRALGYQARDARKPPVGEEFVYQALSLQERFFAKVDVRSDAECWPWKGSRGGNGHGNFKAGGRCLEAHRVSWILCTGKRIRKGLVLDHFMAGVADAKCIGGYCCNPAHMKLRTAAAHNRKTAIEQHAKRRRGKQAA